MEPVPEERGRDKKLKEIIENMDKLTADIKNLKEAFEDILEVETANGEALKCIISHLDTK